MAFTPISNTVPQYEENGVAASGYFIKFYESGTTTPTAMATDSTGTTLLDKCELNTEGYPINGSSAVFIPHINKKYKIALFRNAADADANDLSSAAWPAVDNLTPGFSGVIGTDFDQIPLNSGVAYPVSNIAEARGLTPIIDGQIFIVLGASSTGAGGGFFRFDADDTTSIDNGHSIIVTDTGERLIRNLRTSESYESQDFESITDVGVAANTALSDNHFTFSRGAFSQATPIVLEGKRNIFGAGNHSPGSAITLTGNNRFMEGAGTPITRNRVRGLLIQGDNQTTSDTINLYESYLMQFDEIWLKSCFRGVTISTSDSIVFNGLRVMETSRDYAVDIKAACTNIIFNYSNFETGNEGFANGGKILINDEGGVTSTVDLNSCQFERSGIDCVSGRVNMMGGKLGDRSKIVLGAGSHHSVISTAISTGSAIYDLGFNNVVYNAYARNMSTPEHEWPTPIAAASGTVATYGAAGDEWLLLTSVRAASNAAIVDGSIELKDGATVLDTSPLFSLATTGVSIGQEDRPVYSFVSAVKSVVNPVSVSLVGSNTSYAGIRGAKCVNTNSTFSGGSTGWATVDASLTPSSGDMLVTPSNSTWGIYQGLSGLLTIGKRYIAVAKFSGSALLTLGSPWDGSPGQRRVLSDPIVNHYGDGDDMCMISFEYTGQSNNLSLGSISSSDPVTVRYIALIEA